MRRRAGAINLRHSRWASPAEYQAGVGFLARDSFVIVDQVAAAREHEPVPIDLARAWMVRGVPVDHAHPAVDEPMGEADLRPAARRTPSSITSGRTRPRCLRRELVEDLQGVAKIDTFLCEMFAGDPEAVIDAVQGMCERYNRPTMTVAELAHKFANGDSAPHFGRQLHNAVEVPP